MESGVDEGQDLCALNLYFWLPRSDVSLVFFISFLFLISLSFSADGSSEQQL